jgi:DNA-binding transcriptional regulator YiaG
LKRLESWNGEVFRALREGTGTSAAALAGELGVTEERILRWERGEEVPHGHARELLDAWMAKHPPGKAPDES